MIETIRPPARRPRPPEQAIPPTHRHSLLRRTGGSCRCFCHTDQARMLISLGLALFGTLMYAAGFQTRLER